MGNRQGVTRGSQPKLIIIYYYNIIYYSFYTLFSIFDSVNYRSRTSGEIEEIIPPGYTFYTRISSNTSRILKEIKEQCKIKRCLDGPFQKDCQGLGEGDVIVSPTSLQQS